MTPIPPGATIGILGSGQLGRMLGVAAAEMGYRIHVYAPEPGPANDVASAFTKGGYDDLVALAEFGDAVDVVTYEFENIDPGAVAHLAAHAPVRPSVHALEVSRYRLGEKGLVRELGGRTAPYRAVDDLASLKAAIAEIGTPAILKTTLFGYDGKGQARIHAPADAETAWAAIGAPARLQDASPAILEGFVRFDHEFSLILCRGADGATMLWDAPNNAHVGGILATSTVPAPAAIAAQAEAAAPLARAVADALDYVGVLTLEFFATPDGPVFNEMAPRVHNSGHWTIEGAETSQFENHIRAICGLPLGPTTLTAQHVEMENLIGDDAARWAELFAETGAHVHLYGKHEMRAGRKMGHVTRLRR
jgi:5-(carboxyamino)imidazole ribonucleotide synthase